MGDRLINWLDKVRGYALVQAVRKALIKMIPILMIGSFAVLLESFPNEKYITFITKWNGGMLYQLFQSVRAVTMGMLSVYTAAITGYQIGMLRDGAGHGWKHGTMVVSLGSFFVLSGAETGNLQAFESRGMLLALIAASSASYLYLWVAERMKRGKQLLTGGANSDLAHAIQAILPVGVVGLVTVGINNLILHMTQADSFYDFFTNLLCSMAGHLGSGLLGGCAYIFLSNVLWFFGVHGSDILEGVTENMFQGAIVQNMELVSSGQQATEILTRQFFNNYVMIGGCGGTLCLLIALLLFSKRKETKSLMRISAIFCEIRQKNPPPAKLSFANARIFSLLTLRQVLKRILPKAWELFLICRVQRIFAQYSPFYRPLAEPDTGLRIHRVHSRTAFFP